MMQRFVHVAVCAGSLALTSTVLAAPSLSSSVSAERVEVGRPFTFQLSAMSSDGPAPTSPRLAVPGGFTVHGPSVSSQQRVSIVGGHIERQQGLTATWNLVASRPGRYSVGPPSVDAGGTRVNGDSIVVEVLPPGTLPSPPPRRRRGFFFDDDPFDSIDPFDLFPKMPPSPFDPMDDPHRLGRADVPADLEVDRAADPLAFLRAVATPTRVVVGQQVTLSIFAYGSRGPFEEVNTSEPSRPDFLSRVIVENSFRQPRYQTFIEESPWHAVMVRQAALFPLRSGTLTVGPMRMGFRGRRYPAATPHQGLVRHSEPVQVVVTEPPIAGRPAGYHLGDVGDFDLRAEVDPREVHTGDSVKVTVTLSGTGNLPPELNLPQQKAVDWSKPTIAEDIEIRGTEIGGTKRFSYVVRIDAPGDIDLGEVTLPYYDARRGRYFVARAGLGTVRAVGNAPPAPSARANEKPETDRAGSRLEQLIAPRDVLGPPPRKPWRLADGLGFWLLLAAGPMAVLAATGGARAVRRTRARLADRRRERAAGPKTALREAERAAASGDRSAASSAIERAIYAAIERRTGLRARGILRERLRDELTSRGVAADTSERVVAVLNDCDALRFADSASGDVQELLTRCERALELLSTRRERTARRGRA